MTTNISKIRAALELARDYITSDLASERGAFEGYEGVSRIGEIKADLTNNEEALTALAELERAAAEPVTYQYSHPSGAGKIWRNEQHWNGHTSADARALYAAPPPAKPAPQFVAGEVTKEMCWNVFEDCDGCEKNMAETARHWLDRWRKELGPTLGLVEIREPTPEECARICNNALEQSDGVNADALGHAMFDAVSKWLKEEL